VAAWKYLQRVLAAESNVRRAGPVAIGRALDSELIRAGREGESYGAFANRGVAAHARGAIQDESRLVERQAFSIDYPRAESAHHQCTLSTFQKCVVLGRGKIESWVTDGCIRRATSDAIVAERSRRTGACGGREQQSDNRKP
jgi:hypothetical protein